MITHRQQLAQNYETIANLQSKKVVLIKQKYIETEKCRDVIAENLKAIYEPLKEILLLARKELSFPINEDQYRQIINTQTESDTKNIQNFLSEIREQVIKRMQ